MEVERVRIVTVLPHPPSSHACQGAQEGQRVPSPLCPGYAARKGKHRVEGEVPHVRGSAVRKGRKDQGECAQGEGLHARGEGGYASE